MAHEVKRSKNSNHLCSSDLSSSSNGETFSVWTASGFNDNETEECVLGISLWEQVFGIDLIREDILNYVIFNNHQKISRKLFQTVRLVQKSWLSTATKLLKKCKVPLLIELALDITGINFFISEDITEKRELLEQFIGTFGASNRLKESFLPFKLKLDYKFFRHENYQSVSDCFTRLGNELLELEIVYPYDGGNMSVNFPSLHFPILRKLSFEISGNIYDPIFETPSNFGDNKFGLWLLQSTINASTDLQELAIPYTGCPYNTVPATFEFLHLPPTIVSLELELKFDSQTLETFFQRNQLPNLNHLTILLHEKPFVDGFMYKIFEQFRKTLISLHIDGVMSTGRPNPRTFLRFPVMEKLERVHILCKECELDPKQLISFQDCLPKLGSVYLTYQTEAMLRKWIENAKFEGVVELIVSIINENLLEEQDDFYRSPSREIMTQLSATFPNVNELTLRLNIDSLDFLDCLFLHMKKVQQLELNFHGKFETNSANLVDSMLTGLPLNLVGILKENNVDISESILVLSKNGESQSSIRNLTELNTFSIKTENGTGQVSLVSDFLFAQAFLKMPKLRHLYLNRKFKPSLRMQTQWKEEGRFITYSA